MNYLQQLASHTNLFEKTGSAQAGAQLGALLAHWPGAAAGAAKGFLERGTGLRGFHDKD